MNPFDFVTSITYSKQDIMNEINEKEYNSFLINRSLSYYQDCVLYSNEINRRFDTPALLQYHYLLNSIRKKKRFAKWSKPDFGDDIKIVMEYYKVSRQKAEEYLNILTDKELGILRKRMNKGRVK